MQKTMTVILLLLLGAAVYGFWRTGQPTAALSIAVHRGAAGAGTLVDQSPLRTAQKLAEFADKPEEQALSKELIRLADHELDLAFQSALRHAKEHPPVLTAEAQEIHARLEKAQKQQKADQALAAQLTVEQANASGSKKQALDDKLNEIKLELESDEDQVDDAMQDFSRAGGDAIGRIELMKKEHEDASHEVDTAVEKYPAPLPERFGLINQYQEWSALRRKRGLLVQAKTAAQASAATLNAEHDALAVRIEAAKQASSDRTARAQNAVTETAAIAPKGLSHEESTAALAGLQQIVSDQKDLANFDHRADYEKQLAAVYNHWSLLVAARQRELAHRALQGVFIILVIALVGIFFDSWLERLLGKVSLDRRQVETLRTAMHVAVQVIAVLLILLVILGLPGQLGTFLGLAGAGLTVALKDFIVGFIGWFVLMGKNGVRLGDWVEINGVTGEVVELGMFRTVLLETGNWTDSGHPTGRRVTFMNSFAIEGHYFNFSTSGQWLWDELRIVIPAGQDPYSILKALQKEVLDATSNSVIQAEQEWKSSAHSRDMGTLAAAPAINVKPVIGGVEIAVRYITRATERYQLRAKLYQAAVDLLGKRPAIETPTGR
ncbi:MAG TPA: mechanosensitive ion channel domain-containing protein [Candidatus Dormibacteraeota bacterium]|nr:mechanosensitive ion channel domain-containing protein [Candidatus Dormibacteraeota bacterium]